jgi:hypothetical protein
MYSRWEVAAFAVIMMIFEAPIVWGFGVRYGWKNHADAIAGLEADQKRRRSLDAQRDKKPPSLPRKPA